MPQNRIMTDEHPHFVIGEKLKGIAKDFLHQKDLSYFQFSRVYKNGDGFGIANKPEFILDYVNKIGKSVSYISEEEIDKQTYIYFWNEHFPQEMIKLAEAHNIHQTLGIIERFPTHYNLIAFGRPGNSVRPIERYFNQLDEIRNFVQFFKKEHATLVKAAEDTRRIIPPSLDDPNRHIMLWPKNGLLVQFKGITTEITFREYACLNRLMQGMNLKEIGKDLHISFRTVESHIENCKNKFGCVDRAELRQLYAHSLHSGCYNVGMEHE